MRGANFDFFSLKGKSQPRKYFSLVFSYRYSNTFAIIEFDIHETLFIFWQSKYISQKYYFDGGQKFMHVSYNECSLVMIIKALYATAPSDCIRFCNRQDTGVVFSCV